jgi:hypothetical protein
MKTRPIILGVVVWLFVMGYVVDQQKQFFRGLFLDVSPSAAERIHPGMTLDEINSIIGGPPGDYRVTDHPKPHFQRVSICVGVGSPPPRAHRFWSTTFGGTIDVEYGYMIGPADPNDRAGNVAYTPPKEPDMTYLFWDAGYGVAYGMCFIVTWYVFGAFLRSRTLA